jgi:PKD repeat protein
LSLSVLAPLAASASLVEALPVPAAVALIARQVDPSSVPAPAAGPRLVALRVRDPGLYAEQKDAANRAYDAWAAAHPVSPAAGQTPSSIVALSRVGLNARQAGGSTPPDTTGAIGPTGYIELVNSEIAVYSRATLASPPLATAGEDAFTGSSGTCDGQMKWDQSAQRFEYWSLDCSAAAGSNGYSFGWSKTSSPTPLTGAGANWCKYHVNTLTNLEDYGKLGNDNSFMIVGANEFAAATNYSDSPIFAIRKPANGSAACLASPSITKFTPAPANEFTPEPANIFGSSANGYIVAISGSLTNALRMYTLVGTTPTLTDNGTIIVPAFNVPASVPQPGTTDRLDSSDTRLTQANAAYDPAHGTLGIWTQQTIAGAGNGPSVVRWYELRAGQTTPLQTGTVAVSGAFAFNGAISPTSAGNAAAIDYNVASSTLEVQVRARVHPLGSAPGTMSSETTLAGSAGIDNDFSCPSQVGGGATCRWGDYAGASPDPSGCGAGVWGTNELNGAPDGRGDAEWASQNLSLQLDECPTAAFAVTTATPTHRVPVGFSAAASRDADGAITSYFWHFGDGSTLATTSATAAHTFAAAGTYTVILIVHDSAGLVAVASHSLAVK